MTELERVPAPRLRVARPDDAEAIDTLMKESTRRIFPAFYDDRQTESSVKYIASVDQMLIDDGTYFVIEERSDLIACGGWSKRDKLYTGSGEGTTDARLLDPSTEPARVRAMFVRPDRTRRGLGTLILDACEEAARASGFNVLALMATLPGLQLYQKYGFKELEYADVAMPDGVTIACVAMEKPITRR